MLGAPANRILQLSRPTTGNLEDFMMRNMLFAAIASLTVAFGNLAAASTAPYVGDGSTLDKQSMVTF
jgi:hypothetical protein